MSWRINQVAASHLFRSQTFNRLDTNDDGKLSRAELLAATKNEGLPALVQMSAQVMHNEDVFNEVRMTRDDGPEPVESYKPGDWGSVSEPGISRNDLGPVGNGMFTKTKWQKADPAGAALVAQALGMYRTNLDTNHDGSLSLQELTANPEGPELHTDSYLARWAAADIFNTIDTNKNDQLDDSELRAAALAWDHGPKAGTE